MPSPFPGMDPYLEGYLWPDVHQRLATKISQLLTPRLRPRYVARLALTVLSDVPSQEEIRVMYPDVEVIRARRADTPPEPAAVGTTMTATLSAPLVLPLMEMRISSVQVLEVASNELVTAIEIMSPINKREPGLHKYLDQVMSLREAGVHVIELDLLRRGTRLLDDARLRGVPYLVTLTRAFEHTIKIWPIRLQDKLPTLPVPLRHPDADVPLDLSAALSAVYDEAAYDLSIDYRQAAPPPPLSPEEMEWTKKLFPTEIEHG